MPVENASPSRVYFRDVKPYAVVERLDQLRGPAHGMVELPHSVLWAPGGGKVDLDVPGGVGLAYRAVLAEGTTDDLVRLLHPGRLIAIWPELMLPRRVRALWESRFSELCSAQVV